MGIGCQRNGHWLATSHLSGRGLVQPIKELSSAAWRCAGRGCALIRRQLANSRRGKREEKGRKGWKKNEMAGDSPNETSDYGVVRHF